MEITGREAVELARREGLELRAHGDPEGDGQRDISCEEAIDLIEQDPALVYVIVPSLTAALRRRPWRAAGA